MRNRIIELANEKSIHGEITETIIRLNRIKTESQDDAEKDLLVMQALNVINGLKFIFENGIEIPIFKVTFKRYIEITSDIRFTKYK
jgi:hypothetical protein